MTEPDSSLPTLAARHVLVALEGIDGAGKGTQAARLLRRARVEGYAAELLSYPRYDSGFFGAAIGEFLNGRFGALDEVHPFLAALLFASDRFESLERLRRLIAENDLVILDRYVASNMAHQGAKVPPDERAALIHRIEAMEFDVFRMPWPRAVLLFDLPAETAQTLIAKKSPRSYTDEVADIHEADRDYLAHVRETYQLLAARNPVWHTISCLTETEVAPQGDASQVAAPPGPDFAPALRTVDDIADEVWRIVEPLLAENRENA